MPTLTRHKAFPRRPRERDRGPGDGRGHRVRARQPPAGRGRHLRLGRAGRRRPRHAWSSGWTATRADQTYRGKTTANPIWTPGISADGRLLATAQQGRRGAVLVTARRPPAGRPAAVSAYGNADGQLSPDGRLAVGRAAHARRRAGPGGDLGRTVAPSAWRRSGRAAGASSSARFSPDGRRLAVADARGRVRLYSTATWKPATGLLTGGKAAWHDVQPRQPHVRRRQRRRHRPAVGRRDRPGTRRSAPGRCPTRSAVPMFTPGGTHLIAAQDNGRAFRWDIRPASLVRARLRRRRPPPHARGVGGVPPRPGLRPGVLSVRRARRSAASPARASVDTPTSEARSLTPLPAPGSADSTFALPVRGVQNGRSGRRRVARSSSRAE